MILNRFAFILSVFGAVVAAYMWSMHSHPQDIPCGLHSNECLQVALSPYSRFPEGDGYPVAMWGYDATAVALGHHLARTPCGVGTPCEALLRRKGKIVLLGTDISVLTFYHLLEETMEAGLPLAPFTVEQFHLQSRTRDGQLLDTHCRLFDPVVSRRRNLYKLVPHLKKAGAWREARVGGVNITVLAAVDVDAAVRNMGEQGIYCYD